MKKNLTSLFVQMSVAQLENLTGVVKETLANGFDQPNNKIFTAAELWNIQRQGKRRIERRIFA
ncbi:MAG: hypothetical protein ABI760_06215 [Ferruginibacter sp.]